MAVGIDSVVKQLTDSGIIAQGELENFIPPKASPRTVDELIAELVKQNHLTKFQAAQVAAGKAKSLILGGYTILDKIGAGGMGQVFKALHRRMDRLVAIKMLPPAMTKDAAAAARFEREVRAAAKLLHPNIVSAFDADQANGVHFLVMEYVEGKDLSATVKKDGPFPVAKAVNYILQAARGLEFAHKKGVVHRDIKPANLLLDSEGTVKILDMGLARIESDGNAANNAELTGTGAVMGTVDYMAPEQAVDTHRADARADIYSLGCSLHYLLAGRPTYEGNSLMGRMLAHREQSIPDLRTVQPEVSKQLQTVFTKMVAKRTEDRYQTMTEVIADLERLGGNSGTVSDPYEATAALSSGALPALQNINVSVTTAKTAATKQVAAAKPSGGKQPPWKNVNVLIGAAFLSVLILAGIVLSLQTKDGTLIVEVNQPDALVQVLDAEDKVEVSQKGGVGKVTISVDPGKKRLRVEKDGFVVFGQEFEMESGGEKAITARLEAIKSIPIETTAERTVIQSALQKQWDFDLNVGGKTVRHLERRLPDEPFVVDMLFFKGRVEDSDFAAAAKLTTLNRLVLGHSDANDSAMVEIAKWKALNTIQSLELRGKGFTDAAIDTIVRMPALRRLQMSGVSFSGNGFARLTRLPLNFFSLSAALLTDQALDDFQPMPELQSFSVSSSSLGDSGLERAAAWLSACPRISVLSLSGKNFTDQGIVRLKNVPQLSRIELNGCQVTPAAIAALQKALPNCKIDWDDPSKAAPPTPAAPLGPAPPLAVAPFDAAQAKDHQQAWAKHLGIEVETPNSVGMKMVLIPPGEFMMGSTDEQVEAALEAAAVEKSDAATKSRIQDAERPQHRVLITQPFCMSATEVTVGQFKRFTATGYKTEAENSPKNIRAETYLDPHYPVTDDSPVTWVTWGDAVAFCKWMSEEEGERYRLPTEAEWEFACRAGTTTQYSFGDDMALLTQFGWHVKNSNGSSHPVGTKRQNSFGLFDMHGNVREWCGDWFDERWYLTTSETNPSGPLTGSERVIRGGSWWINSLSHSRSAYRFSYPASNKSGNAGFRIVRELSSPSLTTNFTLSPSSKLFMHDPAFPAWMAQVQAMSAEEQLKAVSKKFVELNPLFDGQLTGFDRRSQPKIENNAVTEVGFHAANVTDLSPLQALPGLKALECGGGTTMAKLTDLSPLLGMKITRVSVRNSQVVDLSPFHAMPLTYLNCTNTRVTPASIAALQQALPNCKIDWDYPAKATTPQPAVSGTK